MRLIFISTLFLLVFLSGCTKLTPVNSNVVSVCTALCDNALKAGTDLSEGPCLSDNNSLWTIENWVCDVAHSPRESVDNQRDNQCVAWWDGYQKGDAPSFVEVTPDCKFIRAG